LGSKKIVLAEEWLDTILTGDSTLEDVVTAYITGHGLQGVTSTYLLDRVEEYIKSHLEENPTAEVLRYFIKSESLITSDDGSFSHLDLEGGYTSGKFGYIRLNNNDACALWLVYRINRNEENGVINALDRIGVAISSPDLEYDHNVPDFFKTSNIGEPPVDEVTDKQVTEDIILYSKSYVEGLTLNFLSQKHWRRGNYSHSFWTVSGEEDGEFFII
jgi:hypothetical protein